MRVPGMPERETDMTKHSAESETPTPRLEVGLVRDEGTSLGGFYGLTDLFTFAGGIAQKGAGNGAEPPVRITHWQADGGDELACVFDSQPGTPHALTVLIIPGNFNGPVDGYDAGGLISWLRKRHDEGVVLAGACGGVFILARTGFLAGRLATTHWDFSEQFAAQFPEVFTETDEMVIDYGDVMTAGGVLAWADLGLRIVERFLGPALMRDTARFMNVDPPGREQRFYSDFNPPTKHGDRPILKAQHLLASQREHLVSIAELARHAGLEQRTFLRRFVLATGLKPSEYQQRIRMSRAREVLEFSRTSIDEVASRIGYNDVAGFRRVFRKVVGLTPSEYRHRFSRLPFVQQAAVPERRASGFSG